MHDPGFSLNFFLSNWSHPSTTSLGGAAPSSKAQSWKIHIKIFLWFDFFNQDLKIICIVCQESLVIFNPFHPDIIMHITQPILYVS